MKKKSSKLRKLEQNRFSILTDDLEHCYFCKRFFRDIPKDDLHEIYGGSNRQRSMKHGFVAPLCRNCHQHLFVIYQLKKICQEEFEKDHTREEFIRLIGKSYL